METKKVFELCVKLMGETKEARSAWYKNQKTLSKLLHTAQTKDQMPFTKPLFEAAGLPTNGKVSQTIYLTFVKNFVTIKGEKLPAVVTERSVYEKDENGKAKRDKDGKLIPMTDKNGNKVKTYKLSAVKPGTWTIEKLLKAVTGEAVAED